MNIQIMLEKCKKAFAANLVLLLPACTTEMFHSTLLFNFQMIGFLGIKIEKCESEGV